MPSFKNDTDGNDIKDAIFSTGIFAGCYRFKKVKEARCYKDLGYLVQCISNRKITFLIYR